MPRPLAQREITDYGFVNTASCAPGGSGIPDQILLATATPQDPRTADYVHGRFG